MSMLNDLQTKKTEVINVRNCTKKDRNFSRLRTLKQCHEFIKDSDPDSAITPYFIRTLCNDGKIEFITTGNKILVYLESLLNFINITA